MKRSVIELSPDALGGSPQFIFFYTHDSVNALSIALTTGIDCPDILVLDQMEAYEMDIESIAGNGAFADLEPFFQGQKSVEEVADIIQSRMQIYLDERL